MKVMNQRVINVSIVQKIADLPNAKRWLIDSHELVFWKNIVDAFCVRRQDTPFKRVLQNIFVENAMENTTFLFVTKEKIEIAMPCKMKVRIALLLLSIRVKVFCALQSARADVFDIETKSSVKTRILFDTGSQRCYVN